MGERARTERDLPAAGQTTYSGRDDPAGLTRALRLYWLAFGLFLVAVVVGLAWDRAWHATHAFDTFYSPPHRFVYSTTALAAGLVAVLAVSPELRVWFGPPCRALRFPSAMPGALTLLGGGFGTLALAGVLDDAWHSRFGLDETGWSFPHAMIGWGLLLIVLGFVAARRALRPYRPVGWATALPLGALWAGAALAFVRLLTRRPSLFLGAVALWSLLTTLNDRGFARRLDLTSDGPSIGPALLSAAIALVLLVWARLPERSAWTAAVLLGSRLGGRVYGVVEQRTGPDVQRLVAIAGLALPFLLGMVDLYLRHATV